MSQDERPAVLSDAWRQSLVLSATGMGSHSVESLPQWSLPRSDWLEGAARIGVHSSGNMCALATANGRTSNSFGFFSLAHSNLKIHTQVATVHSPFQASCMLWAGTTLFVGSNLCRIAMYPNISPDPETVRNYDFSSAQTLTATAQKMRDPKTGSVAAGDWAQSSCITDLGATADNSTLVAIETYRLHYWDVETQKCISNARVSSGTALSLSPSPSDKNIVAVGSATSTTKVVDLRSPKDSVWKSPKPVHNLLSPVRQVALSPLMEHWLMTGTDGGSISVWDIRGTTSPVLTFDHHQSILTGLAWSPLHAELLASSGVDGSTRVYSFRHPPDYTVASARNSAPTIGLSFVATENDARISFPVTATTSGEITTLALSPIFIDILGEHNLREMSEEAEACERLAYLRHLKEAEQKIRLSITHYVELGDTESAVLLSSLLHKHEPMEYPGSPSGSRVTKAFNTDVRGCCKKLPPLYPYRPSVMLTNLELNLTFVHWTAQKRWKDIVDKVKEMDTEDLLIALQPEVYGTLVKAMSRHVWGEGCEFFLDTCDNMELEEEDALKLALFLTGEMVEEGLGLKEVLEELRKLKELTDLLQEGDAGEGVIEALEDGASLHGVADTVKCVATIRLYCSALMQNQQLAKVVWLADYYTAVHLDTDIQKVLHHIVTDQCSRYKDKLEHEEAMVKSDQLNGRQFLRCLHNVLLFAVEVAVACRQMVYMNHQMMYLHIPKEGSILKDSLQQTAMYAEQMRSIVKLIFSHAASAGAAVEQECTAYVQRSAAELTKAIQETKLDTRGETLSRTEATYVKHSEVLLSSFKSNLGEQ